MDQVETTADGYIKMTLKRKYNVGRVGKNNKAPMGGGGGIARHKAKGKGNFSGRTIGNMLQKASTK